MPNYAYKYPKLNDGAWLRRKYIDEGLSTARISTLAGAKTANSARQALIRHGITLRSISDGLTINRQDDGLVLDHAVIEGCLLGDGSLRKWNEESPQSYPAFWCRHTTRAHVVYVAKQLCPSTWRRRIKREVAAEHHARGRVYKNYVTYLFRTLVHQELLSYFERWYPTSNGFQKRVPRDFQLDATSLLHWFLDDGSSSTRSRVRGYSTVITFCSESFSKTDQLHLCRLLAKLGIEARPTPCQWGSGWRIRLRESSVEHFYEVIGAAPFRAVTYKWKKPRKR